ncbi:two-component response regulator ORR24-like isoform X1 [Zingiber officinale]|uniref:Two-component response regulator n=1 Tax=Zingiber officinale TaxID=94328 RepID=A0A8J5KIX2_ZINOF|nr:two-component response regulator ORR24-like isoform X1 [Zingiber officinale]KAG6485298.1 hypothetical protein ZIOFF_053832 [Zingiber officinale]
MMLEESKGSRRDQFPVGMRVLAVDDDPLCLKLLEALLLHCQYNVTTTDKAITALNLLRENKDRFDLVISDVHMPDMDGFKLLELVGLEMDLPVIMLSANGNTQTVMQGISHGACDYLLKPVRIEELRNIWQHVIRRRRFEKGCNSRYDDHKTQVAEDGNEADELNGKINKKRKDQREATDEDDSDDDLQENDDPSCQKKPRVVWTIELHRKFVAAVNQLGIEKAVPKKILDLMNVEKLTRENVASHLQACFSTFKYRLYLKRLSLVAGQQASVVASVGGRHSSYLNMASLNGFRNYYTIGGSRQLPTIGSLQSNGVLGRMNGQSMIGMQGLLPSPTVQHDGMHKSTSYTCIDNLGKIQGISLLGNHQMNLELEPKNQLPAGFSSSELATGPKANSFQNVTNSHTPVQANKQKIQLGGLCDFSPVKMSSSSTEFFDFDLQDISEFSGNNRSSGVSWQGAAGSTDDPANTLVTLPLGHNVISSGNIGGSLSSTTSHGSTNPFYKSPNTMAIAPLHDPTTDSSINNQVHSDNDLKLPHFSMMNNSKQRWGYAFHPGAASSAYASSSLPDLCNDHTSGELNTPEVILGGNRLDVNAVGQLNFADPLITQNCMTDDKGEYGLGNHAIVKPDSDDVAFPDIDIYSIGARI